MLELLAICALLFVGFAVVSFIAVVGFFLKVVFKILLLPVGLFFGLLKLLFFGVLIVVGLAVAPVVVGLMLVVAVLALPLLFVLGVFGAGAAMVGA